MKTLNIVYLVIGIVGGIILAVVAVLAYMGEKPSITGTGEYSSWNTPNNVSFGGYASYAVMDIRNDGDAEAKELKLINPFRGVYIIDGKGEPVEFENSIPLADLNPREGFIVEVWSQTSLPWDYLGNIYVTHTRGTSNVDFGFRSIGVVGKIFKHISRFWLIYVLIVFIGVALGIGYFFDHKKPIPKV